MPLYNAVSLPLVLDGISTDNVLDLAGFYGVYWTITGAAIASFIVSLIIKRHTIDKPLESKFMLRAAGTTDEHATVAASTSGYHHSISQDIPMTDGRPLPLVGSCVTPELDTQNREAFVAYYITPSGRIVPINIAQQ